VINILIPLAGPRNQFYSENDFPYPVPLLEFCGKTMIEHILENFQSIDEDKHFIFVVNSQDCKKYYIDNVLNILTNHQCSIVKVDNKTKGAACSALMAIEVINNAHPLIITNADQLLEINLQSAIDEFKKTDASVIIFESIHPRWSYVNMDGDGKIVESAEKRPISKHAIAGFYYYKQGCDFVESASEMIRKDAHINGTFFVSPTLNEMVLKGKTITALQIDNNKYHTFYTPHKVEEYEREMSS
jgi:NDP-sugar pyrophosphorylase family protein